MKHKAEVNVSARNHLGQFIRECEMAGNQTVKDMIEMGAEEARRQAPVGHRHDRRTVPLRDSIFTFMFNRTNGMFGSSARHALPQETGARPHVIISDKFSFYWENAGRMWIPGLFQDPDIINHPGNPPQPFLRPALNKVLAQWRGVAKRNYPN